MLPLFIYILKAILVSGILLGYYWIGLRNTRFHYYNRFYLVGAILLSLFLPLLDLQWFSFSAPAAQPVQQVVQYIFISQSDSQMKPTLGWEQVLAYGLFLVTAILVCYFLIGIYKVYRIKAKGRVTVMERFDFIETVLDEAPFSFFRNLFWREDLPVNDETGQRMLKHELTHIEHHHSLDKLFIALATYVFWMNPFFWLIRKELEVVHEFIADEEAVAEGDAEELAKMLLKAHYHSDILSVGQSFFYSSIKRRIIMLTSSKKVSYSYARRILILPVAIGILALLSFTLKDALSDAQNEQMYQSAIKVNELDTIPAKYRDPKTGKIKGSFQIDIDGDMASFKDVKSKKELFKVPLSELSAPANKVISVEGFPLDMSKKVMFLSGDSSSKSEFVFIADRSSIPGMPTVPSMPPLPPLELGKPSSTRIIINGKEVTPAELDKLDPSIIKTIDIKAKTDSDEKGVQKVIIIKRDTVIADGKERVDVPLQDKVIITQILADTSGFKTISDLKTKENVSSIIIKTVDDKLAEQAEKNSKTLTVTTTDKGGKKTVTYIQKHEEKSELPKDVLYIIDGKEMESGSIKDVDPNSIKMVNVLKGENAVKKYGDKGKNGVIEITTKK